MKKLYPEKKVKTSEPSGLQGCIIRSILPSGMGARGVSSEHVENMEMFSGSPLRCSPFLQLANLGALWFSENRALVSRIITKGVERSGVCTIVTRHASIKQMTQKSLEGF